MYLAHYTKRFIPEFDAECRLDIDGSESAQGIYNSAEDLTLIQLGGTVFF